MSQLQPEARPSENCGACSVYSKEGYKECYCACHRVGNYCKGFHHFFNYVNKEYIISEHTDLMWGKR
jgi:hypothetical protein